MGFLFAKEDGTKVQDFRKAWTSACKRAGVVCASVSGVAMFHDFRRTGVRNLMRAGSSEGIVMKICGHLTRHVFDAYNITSEEDLLDAAAKLSEHLKTKRSNLVAKKLPQTEAMVYDETS